MNWDMSKLCPSASFVHDWEILHHLNMVDTVVNTSNSKGQSRKPLLPIEFENVIIDTLHVFLGRFVMVKIKDNKITMTDSSD